MTRKELCLIMAQASMKTSDDLRDASKERMAGEDFISANRLLDLAKQEFCRAAAFTDLAKEQE